jgi:hypothetical protein
MMMLARPSPPRTFRSSEDLINIVGNLRRARYRTCGALP